MHHGIEILRPLSHASRISVGSGEQVLPQDDTIPRIFQHMDDRLGIPHDMTRGNDADRIPFLQELHHVFDCNTENERTYRPYNKLTLILNCTDNHAVLPTFFLHIEKSMLTLT
jgi:hypothetical protein